MTHYHLPQDIESRYSDREYAQLIAHFWNLEAEDPLIQAFSYRYPIAGDLHDAPYGFEFVLDCALIRKRIDSFCTARHKSSIEEYFGRSL